MTGPCCRPGSVQRDGETSLTASSEMRLQKGHSDLKRAMEPPQAIDYRETQASFTTKHNSPGLLRTP